MTIKPQTLWIVLATPIGYRAQCFVYAGKLFLPSDALAAPDLCQLRAQFPRRFRPDERFHSKDPNIIEAWAA